MNSQKGKEGGQQEGAGNVRKWGKTAPLAASFHKQQAENDIKDARDKYQLRSVTGAGEGRKSLSVRKAQIRL
jgi:hypothetical protein